jgi:glycosyltransferase involved in cell wall biosynthesis
LEKTIILLPVFNDWKALEQLLKDLEEKFSHVPELNVHAVVVNDGSTEPFPSTINSSLPVSIINLTHNSGHQKAIAIGLSYIYHHIDFDKVLVMDADGDDVPEDAIKLLEASQVNPGKIIVGWRSERKEKGLKKFLYTLYLTLFRILAGEKIRFGNFCVLPRPAVKRLIYKGDIWLHLPGGIIKSKWPYLSVLTTKGNRYYGKSKMSFTSLFYHGIGAIAAFIDIIAIRLLIASGVAIGISILGLLAILIIKVSTDLAIPGWASLLTSSIIVIILISFLIALFLVFTFLTSQSYRKFIPGLHYNEFIENHHSL